MKWSALHDAANTVAMIAAVEAQAATPQSRNFPVAVREADATRKERIEQGIEDLTAIMEPGISALLSAHARGADPQSAAHALWQEFVTARDALLALATIDESSGPLRSA